MTDLWVPPAVRGLEQVAPGVHAKLVEGAPVPGPDDGLFLPPKGWGEVETEDGRTVPSVHVDYDPLRQAVLDANAESDLYGFIGELGGLDLIKAGFGPLAYWRWHRPQLHLYFFTHDAPAGWVERAMGDGYAIELLDRDGTTDIWVATGKMHLGRIELPPSHRSAKVGRNEKCTCGSGLKFKRCCGAAA